jgi:alpha-tubulin suppressor-like RCC1 family protein
MVSVLPSSVVDRVFEPRSGKTKDYTICICYFSAKHAVVLRRRSKEWMARNQDNVQIIANISTKCVAIFSVMFDIAISVQVGNEII